MTPVPHNSRTKIKNNQFPILFHSDNYNTNDSIITALENTIKYKLYIHVYKIYTSLQLFMMNVQGLRSS